MFPLTHDEEVVLLLHGLVDDLGGDLAGVVARHVRVHLPQHHALSVTTPALQQHQEDIRAMARSPIIMMIFRCESSLLVGVSLRTYVRTYVPSSSKIFYYLNIDCANKY